MARAGRPRQGPDKPTGAELELFDELRRGDGSRARLEREVHRIKAEARSWITVDRPAGSTDLTQDYANLWLRDLADLKVEGLEEPHPYVKVTFLHRPTKQRIAYPIPLVSGAGEPIDGALGDLQEVLDTEDLGAKHRVSGPDAEGYRWLHL